MLGALAAALASVGADARLVVAFSGGLDSSVLLDAAARLLVPGRLVVCHVHHGLQAAADDWPAHCAAQAARLGLRFELRRLQGRPGPGESVEAWAREHRYKALWSLAREHHAEAMLVAHHLDDQAETLLIRVSRGSGPEGLGSMAGLMGVDGVAVLRPFLGLRRSELERYARQRGLEWIEDPMNTDEDLLRVAIRSRVMPVLETVAPGFVTQASRSAGLLREATQLLGEFARADLALARRTGLGPPALDRGMLRGLTPARRALLARAWMAELGLPMPSQARLEAWLAQMVEAASAHAQCRHAGWVFVRYRDRIEAFAPQARPGPLQPAPAPQVIDWRGEGCVTLADWGLRLRFGALESSAVSVAFASHADESGEGPKGEAAGPGIHGGSLSVVAGVGAERVRLPGASVSRSLRKLWQEAGVPPWLRPWLPRLRWEDAASAPAVQIEPIDPDDPRAGWLNRW